MGRRVGPNLAGRQLCRRLQKLRQRAGLTQVEAAKLLLITDKKLSRLETYQIPDPHLLKSMMDLYGVIVNDWEPIFELWERATTVGWWRAYDIDNQAFPSLEHDACLIQNFELDVVAGLIQTEPYMRAVLSRGTRTGHSKDWINNQVAVRLRRAERLFEEDPLNLHVVMDEYCLRRKFGHKVMHGQLTQILERSALPNVTIQVVADRGAYPGVNGPFAVLSYPDPEEAGVVFLPHATGAVHLEDPKEVKSCKLDFEHIAKVALGPDDTRAFVEQVIAEL